MTVGHIQAVDRALQILEALAEAGTPLTLSAISARAGLHVSTAYRLLRTLHRRGFVEQDTETGQYRIGVRAFRVGSSFLEEIGLGRRLRPMLADLAARTGETANLVVRDSLEAVYIDHVIGNKVSKLFTEIGQRVPLHCTAVGKVLLAYAPPAERDDLLAHLDLRRLTPNTITSRSALRRELVAVRSAGCAVDREEHELGVACVAAPVWGASGHLVAAMGVSGPGGRVLTAVGALSERVRAAAAEASRALGGEAFRASEGQRQPGRKGVVQR
ncbi:MAG: IclR family transcriptional regulator [Armatimonadota bacterium]|nr:IclR family transcriptional regulator [Armatimonadota bacterium]